MQSRLQVFVLGLDIMDFLKRDWVLINKQFGIPMLVNIKNIGTPRIYKHFAYFYDVLWLFITLCVWLFYWIELPFNSHHNNRRVRVKNALAIQYLFLLNTHLSVRIPSLDLVLKEYLSVVCLCRFLKLILFLKLPLHCCFPHMARKG